VLVSRRKPYKQLFEPERHYANDCAKWNNWKIRIAYKRTINLPFSLNDWQLQSIRLVTNILSITGSVSLRQMHQLTTGLNIEIDKMNELEKSFVAGNLSIIFQ